MYNDHDRPPYDKEEANERESGKLQKRSVFWHKRWQIAALSGLALVVVLASIIIYLLLRSPAPAPAAVAPATPQSTAPPQATVQATPTAATDATPTQATVAGTPTSIPQAGLPCIVDIAKWTSGSADWKVLNSIELNDGTNQNAATNNGPTLVAPCQLGTVSNYAVESKMQVVSTQYASCFGITARGTPSGNDWQGYRAGIGDCGYSSSGVVRLSGPNYLNDAQIKNASFDPGKSMHTYRVEVKDNTITFFIDGNSILTLTDNRFLTGAEVGLWSQNVQLQVSSFKITTL
jgi:hypothetical protein